ncbi:MAG: hypothetical protein WC048_15550 [Rhizobium sp.]
MTDDPVSFETLSAYVDGELSPKEAARVGQAVAADPVLARQVSVLQALRAGVSAIGGEAGPVQVDALEPKTRRFGGRRLAGFATVAMLSLSPAAGILFFQPAEMEGDRVLAGSHLASTSDVDLRRMAKAYESWGAPASQGDATVAPTDPRLSRMIAATGLRLVETGSVTLQSGITASQANYIGPNSCRLSLFEIPASGTVPATTPLVIETLNDLQIARWSAARHYVVISHDMNHARFAAIAGSLTTATQRDGVNDNNLIAVLSLAREHCLG